MTRKELLPTTQELIAFKCIFFMDMTHKEAAERMGISRQRIGRILKALSEKYPDLKELICPERATPKKKLSYFETMDYDVEEQW